MKTFTSAQKRGRRTLCTPDITKKLCHLFAAGHTVKMACDACGISETTFNQWIRRGEAGEKPFSQFAVSINARTREGGARFVYSQRQGLAREGVVSRTLLRGRIRPDGRANARPEFACIPYANNQPRRDEGPRATSLG